jgi:hypothetical protein
MAEWRVGKKLLVTLYRDEVFVGHVNSPEIAAEIVRAMNAFEGLKDAARKGRERSPDRWRTAREATLASIEQHVADCGRERSPQPEDERPAECCCAGCIGMGPCDDDLGKSDDEDIDDHPVDCGCAVCLQERDELFS